MNVDKVTISIESALLKKIDSLVKAKVYPNRSRAIQDAVLEKMDRMEENRLARECLKLDIDEEQALADEGLASEVSEWQLY